MEPETCSTAVLRRLAQVCALIGGGAALAVGVGWMFGRWRFATFGADYIPMAPLTAWLIFALSGASFLRAAWPDGRRSQTVGGFTAASVTLICVLHWVMWLLGIDFPLERWLAPTTAQVGDVVTGRMSPLTAVGLLLTSAALLSALPPRGQRQLGAQTATVSATAVLLIGLAVMLGYASGLPLLYGSGTIPMALLTAVAFALLGAGLLLAAAPGSNWWTVIAGGPAAGSLGSSRRFEWGLLAALVFLIGAISVVGSLYLRRQVAQWRTTMQDELSAIGDLKAGQIGNWLHERRGDAEMIFRNSALIAQFKQLLARPVDNAARQELLVWMEDFRQYYGYERIQLCDAQAAVILSVPPAPTRADPHVAEHVRRTLRSKTVVFSDLHFGAGDSQIHLGYLIPIGVQAGPDAPADGVLILRSDAHAFLYPLIQSWPAQRRTAETLLVRRDGDEVLFLNELRHRQNTALSLRQPLDAPHLPAAAAVRGEVGVREGLDYRGVPVLAAIRAVPGSPWFMVAKVDREEVLAPLRRQAWATGMVLALLIGIVALGVMLLWRQRSADFLLRELTMEHERKSLAERIGYLSQHANDIMLFTDQDWRIVEANDRAVAAYGYTLDELQRLTLRDLRAAEDRDAFDRQARQMDVQNGMIVEVVQQRKDGSTFPAESSMWSVRLDGQPFRQAILRDITQRKADERAIERLTRLYVTLSEINQSIVRVTSHDELFRETCRVMAEFGGFKVVWVGWRNPETQQVVPVARGGDDEGYLDSIKVYADARPEGHGPVGTCIREDRPCVFNDFLNDPQALPWRPAALAHDIRAVAASPIHFQGEVWGSFTVYDEEANVFQDKEVALLEEAALDISYAMEALERERQRQQAELALRESELVYHSLVEQLPQALCRLDCAGRITFANSRYCEQRGRPLEDLLGKTDSDLFSADLAAQYWADSRQVMETGKILDNVERRLGPDGRESYVHVVKSPLRSPDGQTVGLQCMFWDVTDRKRAEDAIVRAKVEWERTFDAVPDLIALIDTEHRIVRMNRAMASRLGCDADQMLGSRCYEAVHGLPAPPESCPHTRLLGSGNEERSEVVEERLGGIFDVTTTPLRDEAGQVIGSVHVARDITDRKRAEAALRESEEQFRAIFELASIGMAQADPKTGQWLRVNQRLCAITGYSAREMLRRRVPDITHPDDRQRDWDAFQRVVRGEVPDYRVEKRYVCKDGSSTWVNVNMAVIRDAAGQPTLTVATIEDITQRKQSEEEIRKLNAELEQRVQDRTAEFQSAYQELEAFSYSVSHDLRAPLRAINGYGTILRKEYAAQLDLEGLRFLDSVIAESERMGRLIDDLLAFSRLGRQPLQRSRVDMENLARTVFAELAEREPGRTLRLSLEPIPPARGDPSMIRLIWVNLLANAIKYTSTREVAEITIQSQTEGGEIAYCVQDNGVGFDMKYAGKLFGVFQRLHGPSEFPGTGVGLALVQRILLRHGGRVWADARIDAGATFFFTLPRDSDGGQDHFPSLPQALSNGDTNRH